MTDLGQSVCRVCGEDLLPEEVAEERQSHCFCALAALPIREAQPPLRGRSER
jgi:hypothetical protein